MVSYFYKTFYQNLHVLQGGFDLKKLTLIVPCFNEQEALPFFYKEAISVLKNLNYEYELLFINDGSKDNTLNILKDFADRDACVKYISFSLAPKLLAMFLLISFISLSTSIPFLCIDEGFPY